MRIFKLTILTIFISFNCIAGDQFEMSKILEDQRLTSGQSYYDSLSEFFNVGETPKIEHIINTPWSGRCFLKESPNTPTNAGYIFREKKWYRLRFGITGGAPYPPQFPFRLPLRFKRKEPSYEANSYWLRDKPPHFFDTLTIRQVNRLLRRNRAPYLPVKFLENGIVLNFADGNTSTLKRIGDYLIEEITQVSISHEDDLSTEIRDVGIRCYYFISNHQK